MSKFKVGDWIRSRDGLDISKVTEDTLIFYKDGFNVELEDEWELWAPVDGEWCWFRNNSRVSGLELLNFSGTYLDDEDYRNYEPFIGNLPNFIK